MKRKKILFLGDSPSGNTGLGRILRDVALRTQDHLSDLFDVAVLGGGTPPGTDLKLRHYPMGDVNEWVPQNLPYAWKSHIGDSGGILFCFWDVSRLLWLVHPEQCPDPIVREFLLNEFKGEKWIYPAVDGCGPSGGMPILLKEALAKFDRVLNYTQFSAHITGYPDIALHGIDTGIFYPRADARKAIDAKFSLNLEPDEVLIGIVATNQPRKDWALAFGALSLLNQQGVKTRVWIHTDTDMRHWDMKALYIDFGLTPNVKVFLTPYGLPDDDLAFLYSACRVTLGIGPEGFGYPIAESLCCCTPCITGSYGGQADFVPRPYQVDPIAYRYEGIFAIKRPVYNSSDFAREIVAAAKDPIYRELQTCSWNDIWPVWEAWLRGGL